MKKIVMLALCLVFFLSAGAQVRLNLGFSFGRPYFGYRPPVVVTPRPHLFHASPHVAFIRPRYSTRVIVVRRPTHRY